jgi:hypothetical protein
MVPSTPWGQTSAASVAARQAALRGCAMSVVLIDGLAQNLAREAAAPAGRVARGCERPRRRCRLPQGTPGRAGAGLRVNYRWCSAGAWRSTWRTRRPTAAGETRRPPDARGCRPLTFLTGLFVLTEAGLSIAVAVEVQHRTAS